MMEENLQPEMQSQPTPPVEAAATAPTVSNQPWWQDFWQDKKLRYLVIGVAALVLVTAGFAYYFIFGRETPPPTPSVSFAVTAPQQVASDNEFEFSYKFTNTSQSTLEDANLSLDYPQAFTFTRSEPESQSNTGRSYSFGNVGPGESREVKVFGHMAGQIGDRRDINAQMRYRIAGFKQVYSSDANFTAEIVAADLLLSVIGSSQATVGQEILYTVAYRNITNQVMRDVSLILSLPSDFRVTEANPELGPNNIWFLGELAPGFEGSLKLQGVYSTAATFQRMIEVTATVRTAEGGDDLIARASTITDVANPPIVITQTLLNDTDKVVLPSENLRYRIDIENRSEQSLTNLVLSTDLLGNAFALNTLKANGGILTGRTVTWTPGGVNALRLLRPGGAVSVEFSLDVANPPTTIGERSLIITSQPRITSFELKEPILGPEVALKVKTQIDLRQDVAVESGAWPMRVGSTTNFRINWTLTNTTNTVSDFRVTADLPLGPGSYKSGQGSDGTAINGNTGSALVEWNVGNLEPHTQKSATFVVAFTPSAADAGQTPNIIDNVLIYGTDSFVLQPVFDDTPVGPARPRDKVLP